MISFQGGPGRPITTLLTHSGGGDQMNQYLALSELYNVNFKRTVFKDDDNAIVEKKRSDLKR